MYPIQKVEDYRIIKRGKRSLYYIIKSLKDSIYTPMHVLYYQYTSSLHQYTSSLHHYISIHRHYIITSVYIVMHDIYIEVRAIDRL
jgi:hypothetical protein